MNTPIKREDIRKGDRVRLTRTDEFTVSAYAELLAGRDYTYELIERPVQLPTEPGLYLDKQGDVWERTAALGDWFCLADDQYDRRETEYAPFTLLRPVADVAAEVLAEVKSQLRLDLPTFTVLDRVAAKWATK